MKYLKKVVFFGTHEIAVPTLEKLEEMGLRPLLVVTKPKAGVEPLEDFDEEPEPHRVLEWAKEHDVPVETARTAEGKKLQQRILELEPDILVTADFGQPLPYDLVEQIPRGAVGFHPSVLPKYRGEHAIRAAIAEGYNRTGVTSYLVDEEPFAGEIVDQEELSLGKKESYRMLVPRIVEAAEIVVPKTLEKLDREKGKPKTRRQNHKIATYPAKMDQRYRKAPWSMEATGVFNRMRAFTPGGLLAHCKYRPVKILSGMPMGWEKYTMGEIGTYLGMRQGKLAVLCGDNTCFGIIRLQRPGDDPMSASEFAQLEMLTVGNRFV